MPDRPDPLTDPVARALARFSPAAGLDRDEALFCAGRASARTGRLWKGVVALLLATNAATLTAWLLAPPRQFVVIEYRPEPNPAEPDVPPATEFGPPSPYWTISARRTGELPPPPLGTDARLTESKPLTILSGRTEPIDI
jgi:hypothetical protein